MLSRAGLRRGRDASSSQHCSRGGPSEAPLFLHDLPGSGSRSKIHASPDEAGSCIICILDWPLWTGLSTKASCQPEKPENSQVKTWGAGLNPGVELGPPQNLSSNQRDGMARKNLRNVADTGEGTGGRCCQQNRRPRLGQKGTGSPQNPVSNGLSWAQVIETNRRIGGDEREAVGLW